MKKLQNIFNHLGLKFLQYCTIQETTVVKEDQLQCKKNTNYFEEYTLSDFVEEIEQIEDNDSLDLFCCPQCGIKSKDLEHGLYYICQCGLHYQSYGNSIMFFAHNIRAQEMTYFEIHQRSRRFPKDEYITTILSNSFKEKIIKSLIIDNLTCSILKFKCPCCQNSYNVQKYVESWTCDKCDSEHYIQDDLLLSKVDKVYSNKILIK
jgi:Zn finger protein HypA/HybF involved in hydrogenase expression